MATFTLELLTGSLSHEWRFHGGKTKEDYLKPGEIGKALVSEAVELDVEMVSLQDTWSAFWDRLECLLVHGVEPSRFTFSRHCNCLRQYRMVICSTSNLKEFRVKGQPEVVSLPVKVKLMSNIRLSLPRSTLELGCLARLAKVCGPQNVVLRVEDLDPVDLEGVDNRLQFTWKQEDLCWETETELRFNKTDVSLFGKKGGSLDLSVGKVEVELTNAGVAQVLQEIYGRPGVNWTMQKQLLEGAEFADVEIKSNVEEAKKGLKCHRIQLAGASPVFATMLGDNSNSDGPSDTKRGKWKEAQSRTVELPESEDAIEAMVHFVYYGDCQRIFRNRPDVILELLEAGEKYEIPTLVDVAAFVLLADAKEGNRNWFTPDVIMSLFQLSRYLEGKTWDKLKVRGFSMLSVFKQGELQACEKYRELHQVAVKLGPVYKALLESKCDGYHDCCLSCLDPEAVWAYNWHPDSVPSIENNVNLGEAKLVYDFLQGSQDFNRPRNLDYALGLVILAEFCGEPVPQFATGKEAISMLRRANIFQEFAVEYLVDLGYYSREKKGTWWKELFRQLVRVLKNWSESPTVVQRSKKLRDMLEKDRLWRVSRNSK